MAKLSARGRIELVRMSKETTTFPEDRDIIWEKITLTLMSDNKVLEKRDVRFTPDQYDPSGRFHTWGWKVLGKVKEGVDKQRFIECYGKKGYVVVSK